MAYPWLETPGQPLEDDPIWPEEDVLDSPPEGSGYQETESASNCGSCLHQLGGVCHLYRAKVDPEKACYSWAADLIDAGGIIDEPVERPFDQVGMAEMMFSETQCSEDERGLIWKPALRTGEWAMSPGPGQRPTPRPLRVRLRTENPTSEIGLENLVEAFQDRAMDHVTIPLSHADRVDENTGFIEQLRIVPDEADPSSHILMAGYRFTEPDIKDKVKRGTIANSSVGVLFNYIRKRDGKKFPQALGHIALTNKPWIDGLTPFGVNAAEGATEHDGVVYCAEVNVKGYTRGGHFVKGYVREIDPFAGDGVQSAFVHRPTLGPTGADREYQQYLPSTDPEVNVLAAKLMHEMRAARIQGAARGIAQRTQLESPTVSEAMQESIRAYGTAAGRAGGRIPRLIHRIHNRQERRAAELRAALDGDIDKAKKVVATQVLDRGFISMIEPDQLEVLVPQVSMNALLRTRAQMAGLPMLENPDNPDTEKYLVIQNEITKRLAAKAEKAASGEPKKKKPKDRLNEYGVDMLSDDPEIRKIALDITIAERHARIYGGARTKVEDERQAAGEDFGRTLENAIKAYGISAGRNGRALPELTYRLNERHEEIISDLEDQLDLSQVVMSEEDVDEVAVLLAEAEEAGLNLSVNVKSYLRNGSMVKGYLRKMIPHVREDSFFKKAPPEFLERDITEEHSYKDVADKAMAGLGFNLTSSPKGKRVYETRDHYRTVLDFSGDDVTIRMTDPKDKVIYSGRVGSKGKLSMENKVALHREIYSALRKFVIGTSMLSEDDLGDGINLGINVKGYMRAGKRVKPYVRKGDYNPDDDSRGGHTGDSSPDPDEDSRGDDNEDAREASEMAEMASKLAKAAGLKEVDPIKGDPTWEAQDGSTISVRSRAGSDTWDMIEPSKNAPAKNSIIVRDRNGKIRNTVGIDKNGFGSQWRAGLRSLLGLALGTNLSEQEAEILAEVEEYLALGDSGPLPGGTTKKDNWVDAVGGLPRYVREVARELMKNGHPKSRAIAIAISRIKMWAATSKDPKVKAKAAKAIAEWEAKKARSHAKSVNASETIELGEWEEFLHKRDHSGRFTHKIGSILAPKVDPRVQADKAAFHREHLAVLGLKHHALNTLKKAGARGGTTEQIADFLHLNVDEIKPHLTQLAKKGYVKRDGETWVLADRGAQALQSSESLDLDEHGKEVNLPDITDAAELELQLSEAQKELAILRKEKHEREVDTRIDELSKKWKDAPGLMAEVRALMMADDGEPVVSLMLSETETTEPVETGLSVTKILERVLDAIPDLKTNLSEQHEERSSGTRPDDTEKEPTTEDRALAIATNLGDDEYLRVIQKTQS